MTYDLTDITTVKKLLARQGFTFNKALGQNFITDPDVCPHIAESCGCTDRDGVLEIGPGAGVLTVELAKRAKRVTAIEVDARLIPVLAQTLEEYRNVQVLLSDVLKTDLGAVLREQFTDCEKLYVCANLPYYITSPVIMYLLKSRLPVENITVMVQKEAAERLCAEPGSREAGAVTAAVRYYAAPEILFKVKNTSFTPAPKVDSEVIRLTPLAAPPIAVADEDFFFETVKAAFSQRRKTAANGLSAGLHMSKEAVFAALEAVGLDKTVRAETLTLAGLAALSDRLIIRRNGK
ncbi:MAG: 16S rRNA (adenine(1518)-N(6)/adenine(1519)-N(6))-dimethyltransferase RsmA [Clostridia bacterium]|nr:16S rRNA (adenine(1518)-N(6)/adenine(1519)-N(6))-dimethyltransferase RsmA [Clostridia bacterium]